MPEHAAGLLLETEVRTLTELLESPRRPLVAILGGAKASDKIAVIDRFREVADTVLIGGAMCFPFLAAQGHTVGRSLCAAEDVELAKRVLAEAGRARATLELPVDLVVADRLAADAVVETIDGVDVPDDRLGTDVGPRTAEAYAAEIARAGTVFWNGPMGAFEIEPFADTTFDKRKSGLSNNQRYTLEYGFGPLPNWFVEPVFAIFPFSEPAAQLPHGNPKAGFTS